MNKKKCFIDRVVEQCFCCRFFRFEVHTQEDTCPECVFECKHEDAFFPPVTHDCEQFERKENAL